MTNIKKIIEKDLTLKYAKYRQKIKNSQHFSKIN